MKKLLFSCFVASLSLMATANVRINFRLVLEDDTEVYSTSKEWIANSVNFKFSSYLRNGGENDPTRKYVPLRWADDYEWQEDALRTFTEAQNGQTFTLVVDTRKITITLQNDGTMGTATLDHPDGKYAVDSTYTITATPNSGYRFLYWRYWEKEWPESLRNGEWAIYQPYGPTIIGGGVDGYDFLPDMALLQSPIHCGVVGLWNADLIFEPVFESIPAGADICNLNVQTSPAGGIFNYSAEVTCLAGEQRWISAADVKWADGEERKFIGWSDGSKDLYRFITTTSGTQTFTAQFILASEAPATSFEVIVRGTANKGIVAHDGIVETNTSYFLNAHYGDIIYLQAVAEQGYKLDSWENGSTFYPRYVVVTEDTDFKATFVEARITITAVPDDEQAGEVTGSGSYLDGDIITLEALPKDGWRFNNWEIYSIFNGQKVLEPLEPIGDLYYTTEPYSEGYVGNKTFDPEAPFLWQLQSELSWTASDMDEEFVAHFEELPNGIVSHKVTLQKEDRGADVGWVQLYGANNYIEGEKVPVLAFTTINYAEPSYCALFKGWNDGSLDALRYIDVTKDTLLTALWQPYEYSVTTLAYHTLTVNSGDANGVAWVHGDYSNVIEGSLYTIEAQAQTGYEFDHWSDGNTQAVRWITVLADTTYTAYFKIAEPRYKLTAIPAIESQGEVVGAGEYKEGEEVLIYAVPADGYEFVQWQDGNLNAARIVTVQTDLAQNIYVASFRPKTATGSEYTTITNEAKAVKILRDGQLLILTTDGHLYNTLGNKIQ